MSTVVERRADGTLFLAAADRPLCGDPADDARPCQRDHGHDGPHRHAQRGEWLNSDPDARRCGEREPVSRARCSRDPGHAGAHTDYRRGYWQGSES